jgi:hypothetical protein
MWTGILQVFMAQYNYLLFVLNFVFIEVRQFSSSLKLILRVVEGILSIEMLESVLN